MQRDRLAEVAWDDEDLERPLNAEAGSLTSGPDRPRRRWSRRARWAAAGAAVLAGGGLVGVDVLAAARLDARLARTSGLSVGLGEPLVQVWEAEGTAVLLKTDRTVLLSQATRGVTALRTADGTTRYSLEGPCTVAFEPEPSADSSSLICEEHRRVEGRDVLRLRVYEPDTGEQRLTLDLPSGGAFLVAGGTLVVHGLDGAGRLALEARDLDAGKSVWSWTDDIAATEGLAGVSVWEQAGDVVVSVDRGEQMVLDGASGRPRSGVEPWSPFATEPVALPSGGQARQGPSRPYGPVVEVHRADGTLAWTAAGYLVAPTADDGSGTGLVLVQSLNGLLHARDARTGERRWFRQADPVQVEVVADVVLLEEDDVLRALSARTGDALWSVATLGGGHATDGRRVVAATGAGEEGRLVARDLRTGRSVWQVPVPGGSEVTVHPGRDGVLVGGGGHVSQWRPSFEVG